MEGEGPREANAHVYFINLFYYTSPSPLFLKFHHDTWDEHLFIWQELLMPRIGWLGSPVKGICAYATGCGIDLGPQLQAL